MTRASIVMVLLFHVQPLAVNAQTFQDLEREYKAAMTAWDEEVQKSADEDGDPPPEIADRDPTSGFVTRFRAFADAHSKEPNAIPALVWLVRHGQRGESGPAVRAVTELTEHYAHYPEIAAHLNSLRLRAPEVGEARLLRLFESIRANNTSADAKAEGTFSIGLLLSRSRPRETRPESDMKRAREMFQEVQKNYPDTEPARKATRVLYALDNLQLGKPAPDIVGKSADGKEIRLSQFRGQVVMVDFFGFWCAPCVRELTEHRELMTKFHGRPFTILGIATDADRATVVAGITKHQVTWPIIHNGAKNQGIAQDWCISAYPTVFIVDHEGIIRFGSRIGGSHIDELVSKAEAARKSSP